MVAVATRPCGTPSAYARHLARREEPCQPCRDAHTAYKQAQKARRAERNAGYPHDVNVPPPPGGPLTGETWRRDAACAGRARLMDDPDRVRTAIALCLTCPVLAACSAWLSQLPDDQDPGGVCAASTPGTRKAIRQHAASTARTT